MTSEWQLFAAAAILGLIGWIVNDKLKAIKEDTTDIRGCVGALERRTGKVEKAHIELRAELKGRGCIDSDEHRCVDGESNPPVHMKKQPA